MDWFVDDLCLGACPTCIFPIVVRIKSKIAGTRWSIAPMDNLGSQVLISKYSASRSACAQSASVCRNITRKRDLVASRQMERRRQHRRCPFAQCL